MSDFSIPSPANSRSARITQPISSYIPGFRTGVWWKACTALIFYCWCAGGLMTALGVGSHASRVNASVAFTWIIILATGIGLSYLWSFRHYLRLWMVLRHRPTKHDLLKGQEYWTTKSALSEAERVLRQAVRDRTQKVEAAGKNVERVVRERNTVIESAEEELTRLNSPGNGRRIDAYKRVTLYEYMIALPEGVVSVAGAHASVQTGQRKNKPELFLEIATPSFSSVVTCDSNDGEKVRKFAAQINTVGVRAAKWESQRPQAIVAVTNRLQSLRNETSSVDIAREQLADIEGDDSLQAAVRNAEIHLDEVRAATTETERTLKAGVVSAEQDAVTTSSAKHVPRPLAWALICITLVIAFELSMLVFPLVLIAALVLVALILGNVSGIQSRLTTTGVARRFTWVRNKPVVIPAAAVLLWASTASAWGFSTYKADHNSRAHEASVTAVAVAAVHATATGGAVAHVTEVAAQAVAQQTGVARAHAQATHAAKVQKTQVVLMKTATARKLVAARARAKVQAIVAARARVVAQQHAQATAQAQVQVRAQAQLAAQQHAQATAQAQVQAAAQETQAAQPTNDTYADVNDHPQSHKDEYIQWTCNIYKFLDQNTVGCWEYTGTFSGTGDGGIILDTTIVDVSQMHTGDDVKVYGQVADPVQGTNSFGGQITSPQILVKSITDLGHDPNASL